MTITSNSEYLSCNRDRTEFSMVSASLKAGTRMLMGTSRSVYTWGSVLISLDSK